MAQQNLDRLNKITNPDGTPTDYFIRFMQARGGDLTDAQAVVDAVTNNDIIAGDALDGGGKLIDGPVTIDHAASGVVAGSYSSADIVVDAFGHITAAADGAGVGLVNGILPVVDGSIPPTFIQNPDGSLVFTEIL